MKGSRGTSGPQAQHASTIASLGRNRNAFAQGLGSVGNIQSGGLVDNSPLFGGWLRVLAGPIATATDTTVSHGLKVIPRFLQVLGVFTPGGPGPGQTPPTIYAGTTAWTQAQITFRLGGTSVTVGHSIAILIY